MKNNQYKIMKIAWSKNRDINEYLRKCKLKNNPWDDNGFYLKFGECYLSTESYSVCDVYILFQNKSIFIQFLKNEYVLGCAIFSLIVSETYSYDKNISAYINKTKVKVCQDNRIDAIEAINLIFQYIDESDFFEIEVVFQDNNSLYFQKNGCYFIIDKDHADMYYYNKEIMRRYCSKK